MKGFPEAQKEEHGAPKKWKNLYAQKYEKSQWITKNSKPRVVHENEL